MTIKHVAERLRAPVIAEASDLVATMNEHFKRATGASTLKLISPGAECVAAENRNGGVHASMQFLKATHDLRIAEPVTKSIKTKIDKERAVSVTIVHLAVQGAYVTATFSDQMAMLETEFI